VLGALWRGITRLRLALANLLFLVFLALLYFLYVGGSPLPLPERAALLVNPVGRVVDQKSYADPLQALLGTPSPMSHEVLLRDIIDGIRIARDDESITALVLELDQLLSLGMSKTQEIVVALEAFKTSGKPVVAVGDYYTQGQYLLASYADTVISHPFGGVALEGFSTYRQHYREALEKLSVTMHVFKAGEYKSMAEPWLRNDMSEGEKEVSRRWLEDVWRQYTDAVEGQRGLDPGAVNDYINRYDEHLAAHGGDLARTSLAAGLVDKLLTRSESNDYLVELVGEADADGMYEAVGFERYVSRKREPVPQSDALVGVITGDGNMLDGEHPPGTIGGDSLARQIRAAAEREEVRALVLRINSGGGSVFASEIIRQAILDVRSKGLPVVVSMGSIAASGGYYIAAEADEIVATPATITGSIGVYAMFPTFEDLMARLGVFSDGVGTTDLAGGLRLDRPLSPVVEKALHQTVNHVYQSFLALVAEGRGMSVEEVDGIAQGRVWSAPDALENGLVDTLGTLQDAIALAAAHAELDDFAVEYIQAALSPRDLLMQQLLDRGQAMGWLGHWAGSPVVGQLADPVLAALRELSLLSDPSHLYMRCTGCPAVGL
jgi:protease-4